MGLFSLFNKKKHTNIFDDDLDHLTPEGELPWGWYTANKEFTDRISNEAGCFLEAYGTAKQDGVLKQYAALKSYILYLDDAKKLCASKGVCFLKWFSDIIADQEYYNKLIVELKYLEDNMDDLLKKERRMKQIHERILPSLNSNLLEIIKNEPGIIQSELCKRFDADVKPFVSSELYSMEKAQIIIREKDGRSYKLYLKKK